MPPPATPASRLVRRARAPGSGLDLSNLRSPFVTPSKSRLSSGIKRPHEDIAADANDTARVKRVTSQCILDADGLSSPAPPADGYSEFR